MVGVDGLLQLGVPGRLLSIELAREFGILAVIAGGGCRGDGMPR